jgi:hypothetical protein
MTLDEWVTEVSGELGIDPIDTRGVLDLARDVAHRVARPAAPLTCLLVGLAATSGADVNAVIGRVRDMLPEPEDGDT